MGGAWEQCSQKEIDRIDLGRRIWDKSTPLVTISVNRVIYPTVTDGANRMNYSSAQTFSFMCKISISKSQETFKYRETSFCRKYLEKYLSITIITQHVNNNNTT